MVGPRSISDCRQKLIVDSLCDKGGVLVIFASTMGAAEVAVWTIVRTLSGTLDRNQVELILNTV